jgi:hypothetical protein
MKSIRPIHLALTLGVSLAFACDVTEDPTAPTGAKLTIDTTHTEVLHKDGAADGKRPIAYMVQGMTLAAKGNCNGNSGCGHVQGFVDALTCSPKDGSPNVVGGADLSVAVDLGMCDQGSFYGSHLVALQLVKDDDKTLVLDSTNTEVYAHITLKEQATYVSAKKVLAAKCMPCHTHDSNGAGGQNIGAFFADGIKQVSDGAPDACKDAKDPTKNKKVAECSLIRIKDGSMPKGKGCMGDPSKDSGNPACLTAAELNVIDNWISSGLAEN